MSEPTLTNWERDAMFFSGNRGTVATREQARRVRELVVYIRELRAALVAVEWIETDESPGVLVWFCPWCWNHKWRGHQPGCSLAAALARYPEEPGREGPKRCAMTDRDLDAAVAQVKSGLWNKPDVYKYFCTVRDALAEARQQLAKQAQEIARLKAAEAEHLDYMSQANTVVSEIQDAQRERDAQIAEEAAISPVQAIAELEAYYTIDQSGIGRKTAKAIAAAIRAARTLQEPT